MSIAGALRIALPLLACLAAAPAHAETVIRFGTIAPEGTSRPPGTSPRNRRTPALSFGMLSAIMKRRQLCWFEEGTT